MIINPHNSSIVRGFFCSVRFPLFIIICIIVICSFGYYYYSGDHHVNDQNVFEITDRIIINEPMSKPPPKWMNNEEIQIFREYLRIPTQHPNINYKTCVAFLEKQAASLNLSVTISHPVDDKNPVVVMTWEGSQPELPSIMLNSHMDVVAVFEEYWTHPPFAAEIDEDGNIFARGAQDMKQVGMQYLAAIRALKRDGIKQLKRTIHVVYVPDEENGGSRGMEGFVKTEQFKGMNVGFSLDEGSPRFTTNLLYAYYGERTMWAIEFIVRGQSGHGSRLFEDTPGEKLNILLSKLMQFRKEELKKLKENNNEYANVTSINLTRLKGGVANNVIPAEMSAVFDMRIAVNVDLNEFEQQLKRWCEESGGNITMIFLSRDVKGNVTRVDDSNLFWVAFKNAINELGFEVQPAITIGATDSRFLRRINVSAIGFSPLINTIPKLHDHNEYINANIYLTGIDIYKKLISSVANS